MLDRQPEQTEGEEGPPESGPLVVPWRLAADS
jgi:hypothetical protein